MINNKRGCSIVTNNTTISEPMLRVLSSAEGKLRHKAYLRWYQEYGLEESEMWTRFGRVRDIVDDYVSAMYQ